MPCGARAMLLTSNAIYFRTLREQLAMNEALDARKRKAWATYEDGYRHVRF